MQALQYHDSRSDNQDSYKVTNGADSTYRVDMLEIGVIHVPGRMEQDSEISSPYSKQCTT